MQLADVPFQELILRDSVGELKIIVTYFLLIKAHLVEVCRVALEHLKLLSSSTRNGTEKNSLQTLELRLKFQLRKF